jgi:hypothetical protein
VLRGSAKPLQSRKHERTPLATGLLLELVDREAAVMPFPLEDAKGDHTAGEVMDLRPLRAGLTAAQLEVSRTDSEHCFDLRPHAVVATALAGRQRQAIGGRVLGAVSDGQDLHTSRPPTALRPLRVAPIRTQCLTIEPAILPEATDDIPPIVAHPL